ATASRRGCQGSDGRRSADRTHHRQTLCGGDGVMRWFINRARAILSVNFAMMVEFRVELLFWMVATMLPLIMMGLWINAVEAGDFAMSTPQVARYFLAVFLVRQ